MLSLPLLFFSLTHTLSLGFLPSLSVSVSLPIFLLPLYLSPLPLPPSPSLSFLKTHLSEFVKSHQPDRLFAQLIIQGLLYLRRIQSDGKNG